MDREFQHALSPPGTSPITGPAIPTVEEIEGAGLLEVVQAPGAGSGHWGILGELLASGLPVVFRGPLGHLLLPRDTVRRRVDSQGLPAYPLDHLFRFPLSRVDEWIRSRGNDIQTAKSPNTPDSTSGDGSAHG